MQEHRAEELRGLLNEHVHPGESFDVRWSGTDLEVRPITAGGAGSPSTLAYSEPPLYGLLLRLNEQIEDAGGPLTIWTLLAALGTCLGLGFGWFDSTFGDLSALRHWWVYLVFFFVTLMVIGQLVTRAEHRTMTAHEEVLAEALALAGMTRDGLIAALREDADLTSLFQALKEQSV